MCVRERVCTCACVCVFVREQWSNERIWMVQWGASAMPFVSDEESGGESEMCVCVCVGGWV